MRDRLAMRKRLRLRPATTAVLSFVALSIPIVRGAADPASEADPGPALSRGMATWIGTLDADQRDEALYAFDDDERFDLRLAPLGLEGLTISEMRPEQWAALRDLLGHVLSPSGLDKLDTIRSLEREVAELEDGLFGFFMRGRRDPERYFLAVFGEPGTKSPWGFRFDGHHFSLNATAVDARPVSATPIFLGAQPRVVPAELERAGLRVLADEEESAVAFLNGLSTGERAAAWLPWRKGSAFRRPMSISADVDLVLPEPAGLRRDVLPPAKRAALDALIEVHLANFATPIAARYRTEIFAPGTPITIQYASAGDAPNARVESGRALYYRIQAGGLSIEFDDTAEAADHIHVVFRHPDNDFGRDLLGEHLSNAHGR